MLSPVKHCLITIDTHSLYSKECASMWQADPQLLQPCIDLQQLSHAINLAKFTWTVYKPPITVEEPEEVCGIHKNVYRHKWRFWKHYLNWRIFSSVDRAWPNNACKDWEGKAIEITGQAHGQMFGPAFLQEEPQKFVSFSLRFWREISGIW